MFKKILMALAFITMTSSYTQAALQLEITGGINEGRKILVLPFAQPDVGVDVASVVSADLMRSGKFSPLNIKSLNQSVIQGSSVNLEALAQLGAEAVIQGTVTPENNIYNIEFKLIGLQGANKGKIIAHYKGNSDLPRMRNAAHRVSDRVYKHLTGQDGAFRTRIAYIVYKHNDPRPYQLTTADYDGFNETALIRSTQPIMTPSWSPDGKNIVYVSFEKRAPAIFIQNVYTKQRTKLASFRGLNSSPSWSPDGTKIAMTLSKDGQPDIYYYDLNERKLNRVTSNRAIDTEPTWSDDSKSIIFTSERGGRAQIYKYDFITKKTERVTYQGKMNLSAKQIPGSKSLVVVTNQNGYRVARVDEDGSAYLLTTSQLDESPSVAPNGSMVIYSTVYQGRKGLALVSSDGRFKANLPSTVGEVSSPSWGPIVEK